MPKRQHARRRHQVEGMVRERKAADVGFHVLGIREARLIGVAPGASDHVCGDIRADDTGETSGKHPGSQTLAASYVESVERRARSAGIGRIDGGVHQVLVDALPPAGDLGVLEGGSYDPCLPEGLEQRHRGYGSAPCSRSFAWSRAMSM